MLQLFALLGPLPAKLKQNWLRYEVYFDDEEKLKKFVVDDDGFSYPEFDDLPKDDCQNTDSNTINDGLEQNTDETPSVVEADHPRDAQEHFNPGLYPSIVKVCERKVPQDEGGRQNIVFEMLNGTFSVSKTACLSFKPSLPSLLSNLRPQSLGTKVS